MTKPKKIALLGSTGSIGTQTLEVIDQFPGEFEVVALTAQSSVEKLVDQAKRYRPKCVVIADTLAEKNVREALKGYPVEVMSGSHALAEVVKHPEIDMILTALVGYSGLLPTLNAIRAGKDIALANKETLVVAGALVSHLVRRHQVNLIPVDSEHSAIFQCLAGENTDAVEKVILTASGGPFRGKPKEILRSITKAQALKHPNWSMGAKITIDSATLMNKGLEVIEAKWLFELDIAQVEVVIHPQSIIHSMVQFCDGSIKAQMGLPDMRLPIQYALTFPKRLQADWPRYNFSKNSTLTFEQPDLETFRNLALAFEALKRGGNSPCVLNAANEVAVTEFLNDRLGFLEMSDVVEQCLTAVPFIPEPSYDDYVFTDQETRRLATEHARCFHRE